MNKDANKLESERASEAAFNESEELDAATASAPDRPAGGDSGPQPEPEQDLAHLQQQLEEQTAKAAQHWDKYLRATADFENYKKRMAKDRAEAAKYGQSSLITKLLTVLDNFEMALNATEQGNAQTVQSLKTGVDMIFQQFKAALTDAGLTEVDAQGQTFDPNLHEAVMQQESADVPEGQVLQQLRKGYKLHDRLLRPASVVVAKTPEPTSVSSDSPSNESAPS